jgi:hypothetical protein
VTGGWPAQDRGGPDRAPSRSAISSKYGSVKHTSIIGRRSNEVAHLSIERLRRARDLLAVRGFDTRDTRLACYSGAGFDRELQAVQRPDIRLIGLSQLYENEGPSASTVRITPSGA